MLLTGFKSVFLGVALQIACAVEARLLAASASAIAAAALPPLPPPPPPPPPSP